MAAPRTTYPAQPALVQYPHPVLRKPAAPVTVFDEALRTFCQQMFAVMDACNGVGLAAPQVAVPLRIFVTDHGKKKDQGESQPIIWINPRLENCIGSTVYEEGCLSFPGLYAKVGRHDRFDIVWQDEWGVERRRSLDVSAGDFLGIVVQHELDHLDGKVFVDHLSPAQLTPLRGRLKELERSYRKEHGRDGAVLRR